MTTHPIRRNNILLASALLLFSPLCAVSQGYHPAARTTAPTALPTTALSTAAAQARRDQLAKIPELLADPDPNARVANMEAILATNDATMIQLALRLAFKSDDANLRSSAMRAYIANLKGISFDILLPAGMSRQYEAVQGDQHGTEELFKTYPYVRFLAGAGLKIHLTFTRYNSSESTGDLQVLGHGTTYPFTISGDRLSVNVDPGWSLCNLEFRPSNDMTLSGIMTCQNHNSDYFPKLGISAPLF